MTPEQIKALEDAVTTAQQAADGAEGKDETLNKALEDAKSALANAKPDPVKKELEKVNKKTFTRRERLNFEKSKIEEQLTALDKEEGVDSLPAGEDDKPLTIGDLKKIQKEQAQKTALERAEAIDDESVRELTKHYLKERIVPTGNPEEDFKLALAMVNSLKNAQVLEELERKGDTKKLPNSPSNPARPDEAFTPTEEESAFMNAFGLTKEDVLKARAEKKKARGE